MSSYRSLTTEHDHSSHGSAFRTPIDPLRGHRQISKGRAAHHLTRPAKPTTGCLDRSAGYARR